MKTDLMKQHATLSALLVFGLTCVPIARSAADDFSMTGSTGFPIQYLAGNPVLQAGDRLVGSYAPATNGSDLPTQYVNFQGSGRSGLHLDRYTFTIESNSTNGTTYLFDTNTFDTGSSPGPEFGFTGLQPYALGIGGSSLTFDQFDSTGANQTFGFGFLGDKSDFKMSWKRTDTPINDLGTIGSSEDFALLVPASDSPHGAVWYSFSVADREFASLDTVGSPNWDTAIALFDGNGKTIGFNDDRTYADYSSQITKTLDPGTYYVAVSTYRGFANWKDAPYYSPDGGTRGWSREGFSGGEYQGPLQLNFSTQPVPEQSTIAAFTLAICAASFGALRRRRRK